MAIYVGGTKCNLVLGNSVCEVQLYSSIPIVNGIMLLSSDGFSLLDSKGTRLTIKDEGYRTNLLSLDDYILSDVNGLNLMANDFEEYDIYMSSLDDYVLQDLNNLYLTTRKG